jgi:hypothetical protein
MCSRACGGGARGRRAMVVSEGDAGRARELERFRDVSTRMRMRARGD